MTAALLYGATSGALHAVSGPDHVLSLSPAALREPKGAFRVGLVWGVGHALGSVLLALPLIALAAHVHLQALSVLGQRLAGAVLLITAAVSYRALQRRGSESAERPRHPLWVGLVHGATGASALLLLLPAVFAGSPVETGLYLLAFSVGSTLAMAALTATIGRVGSRFDRSITERVQRALLCVSALLGVFWLVA